MADVNSPQSPVLQETNEEMATGQRATVPFTQSQESQPQVATSQEPGKEEDVRARLMALNAEEKAQNSDKDNQPNKTREIKTPGDVPFWATDAEVYAMGFGKEAGLPDDFDPSVPRIPNMGDAAKIHSSKLPPMRFTAKVKLVFDRLLAFAKNKEARRTLGKVPDQKAEKKKQTQTLLITGIAGICIVAAFVLLGDVTKQTKVPEVKVYQSDFTVAPDTIDKQSFQFQYDDALNTMNAKLKSYEATIEQLNHRIKAIDADRQKRTGKDGAVNSVPLTDLADYKPESAATLDQLMPKTGPQPQSARKSMSVIKVFDASNPTGPSGLVAGHTSDGQTPTPGVRNLRHYRAENPIAANRARHEAENTYLPAGSFASAVVLSGVTAATGGTAANNPVPLLLEIKDMARLPNRFRANVKRCFVTGSATGDLSSERIWIRLDRLSCMSKTGKAIDVKVQGYATGEDGKTGVRARLVTRSGQAIASAITTGLLSGMGKAVSLSASSTVTYSSGASGTTVNDSLRAGIGQGMEDAMDRIVDYYIRLADKIFPVLELDSGRKVDIVLSQGLTISVNDKEDTPTEAPGTNAALLFGERLRNDP